MTESAHLDPPDGTAPPVTDWPVSRLAYRGEDARAGAGSAEAIREMARRIQGVLGGLPATPVVVAENFRDAEREICGKDASGRTRWSDAWDTPVFRIPHPFVAAEGGEGGLFQAAGTDRCLMLLKPDVARKIADPDRDGHQEAVAIMAHEMGHRRSAARGLPVPIIDAMPPARVVAINAASEYLAVRAETETARRFFGTVVTAYRGDDRSAALGAFLENTPLHAVGETSRDRSLPAMVGYNIGTINGYLDGGRAEGRATHLLRCGVGARGVALINRTGRFLTDIHEAVARGDPPSGAFERLVTHMEATLAAPATRKSGRTARTGPDMPF